MGNYWSKLDKEFYEDTENHILRQQPKTGSHPWFLCTDQIRNLDLYRPQDWEWKNANK
jgi:hypothetical protein